MNEHGPEAFFEAHGSTEHFPGDRTDNGKGKVAPPQLVRLDLARYDTEPIPNREWGVRDRFPRRNVALLSGEGAIGKSILLLQLADATSTAFFSGSTRAAPNNPSGSISPCIRSPCPRPRLAGFDARAWAGAARQLRRRG